MRTSRRAAAGCKRKRSAVQCSATAARTHCAVSCGPVVLQRTVGHAGSKDGGPSRAQGRWAMPGPRKVGHAGSARGAAGPPVAVHRCELRCVVRNAESRGASIATTSQGTLGTLKARRSFELRVYSGYSEAGKGYSGHSYGPNLFGTPRVGDAAQILRELRRQNDVCELTQPAPADGAHEYPVSTP
jgi:hypothetical protein